MSAEVKSYTARYVFPVAGPPIVNGVVAVRGTAIDAIEPNGRACDFDFGNAAIIPGLVNAHTHLDLSGARGLIPPTDPEHFTDWLNEVIAFRRTRTSDMVQADIRTGLVECLRSGTTLIGDINSDGGSWAALSTAPIRSVVFREIIGLKPERAREAWFDSVQWSDAMPPTELMRSGLSPHAPYSVRWANIMAAASSGLPVAIHWMEVPAERELINTLAGPFVPFLTELNAFDAEQFIAYDSAFTQCGRHARNLLFIHANYQSPEALWRPNMSVVFCPRTHDAFGHPPHPFREFLQSGVRVCLGTDSLASNPDLDLLAEVRFVHQRYPDVSGEVLLRMATLSGAEALGWDDITGSLSPGKSADFVVVPLPDAEAADPHQLLLANHPAPRITFFRGVQRDSSVSADWHPSTGS